jgi:PII-like signaling protein
MTTFVDGGIGTAALLRGTEGFGPKHVLHTSGQLTLSEDLPMIAIALDLDARIAPVAARVRSMLDEGLVTVEGVRKGGEVTGESWLTVWTARQARIDGSPAHVELVKSFRKQGARAAIALLGVDGVTGGVRQRAGFFSANREVPLLVTGVGSGQAIAAVAEAASRLLPEAALEIRDSGTRGSPLAADAGQADLCRLAVYDGGFKPGAAVGRQQEIVRLLRRKDAPGATAYLGLFGFLGGEEPHGESFRGLRRRVPVLTEVIDTRVNCDRWLREVENLTEAPVLVTLSPVRRLSRPAGPA